MHDLRTSAQRVKVCGLSQVKARFARTWAALLAAVVVVATASAADPGVSASAAAAPLPQSSPAPAPATAAVPPPDPVASAVAAATNAVATNRPAVKPAKVKGDPTQPTARTWKQWPTYHERYSKRAQSGRRWPIRVLFLGDSITEWWDWKDFEARYKKPLGAENFSIGGDQVQNVLWRVLNGEMDGIAPKVVVVHIGTNNLGENSPEEIAAGIAKLVAVIHEKSPASKVLLLGIFPRSDYETLKKRAGCVNAILAKLDDGGKTVRFADVGQNFLGPDGKVRKGLLKDGLHPTREGYEFWHAAMYPILEKMLKSTRSE